MATPTKTHAQEGVLTFLLLALVQASAVWAVQQAGWLTHPAVLTWVSLAALLLGALLARVRAPEDVLHFIALLAGMAALGYAGASTLTKGNFYERLVAVVDRIVKWIDVTRQGGIGTDNLLFLLFLALLAWVVGYAGAWAVYRHHSAWVAILGSGSALVVTVSYAEHLSSFFFLYAPVAIILFVHVQAGRREHAWALAGIQHHPTLRRVFLWQGALAALVLVVGSAWTPNVGTGGELGEAWRQVQRPWLDFQGEFARIFGPIQVDGTVGASTYGPTLALQGGVNLSDQPVLEVSASEARRLRGVTYDRYTGQGWLMQDRGEVSVAANGDGLGPASDFSDRRDFTQTVRVLRTKGDLLFGASLPKVVSVPVRAEMDTWSGGQGGGDTATYTDLGAVRASVGPFRGQEYTIVSAVSTATEDVLRQAGNDYPQRIWQRYTALPRSVPQRVRRLAYTLTRGDTNAYDRAVAIETYLRGLTYSQDPPTPPPGRDIVDFFLFDSKEGYCDYFSSAMVVMLRSIGIPARVVAGYLPGELEADGKTRLVRESDAHSWPEVFFPEYGWVEFEPTASTPAVERPQTEEVAAESDTSAPDAVQADPTTPEPDPEQAADELSGTASAVAEQQPSLPSIPVEVIVAVVAALAVAYGGWRAAGYLWGRHFRGLRPAEATYAKMTFVARWLGRGPRPYQTPFEYAEALARYVPGGAPAIRAIARAYVRHRFGRAEEQAEENRNLALAWQSLRTRLPRGLARQFLRIRVPTATLARRARRLARRRSAA